MRDFAKVRDRLVDAVKTWSRERWAILTVWSGLDSGRDGTRDVARLRFYLHRLGVDRANHISVVFFKCAQVVVLLKLSIQLFSNSSRSRQFYLFPLQSASLCRSRMPNWQTRFLVVQKLQQTSLPEFFIKKRSFWFAFFVMNNERNDAFCLMNRLN
jgi:hypothetical protein